MNPETDYNLQLLKAKMGMANDLKSLTSASSAGTGAQADREKKWKAALDFQSMFLGQMYKAMRKSTMGEELTEKSSGREIFTEMLDQEYARMDSKNPAVAGLAGLQKAGAGTSNSLAAQIYRSLLRQDGQADGMEAAPAISFSAAFAAARGGLAGRRQASGSDGAAKTPGAFNAPALPGSALDPLVEMASRTYGVAKNLIKSVIGQESGSRHLAVSPAGAKGLMQLMDSTAADLGVRNVFNPRENVMAGTLYLKRMLDRFGGDEKLALAAYNAGPGAVERFGGVPPYAETSAYVEKVLEAKAGMDAKDEKDAADAAGKGAAGAAR